jgi:hypothetical protein
MIHVLAAFRAICFLATLVRDMTEIVGFHTNLFASGY